MAGMVDAQGRAWLAYWSFWSGIEMTQICLPSGKPAIAHPTPIGLVDRHVRPNAVEGSNILPPRARYCVLASLDFYCQGVNSSYGVVVRRSPGEAAVAARASASDSCRRAYR